MKKTLQKTTPAVLSAADRWELWLLRALRPEAGPAALAALRERRRRWQRHERAVLVEGRADPAILLRQAERFLHSHPGLRAGLVVTLHLGPYALVPTLLRWSGVVPAVLVAESALAAIRPEAEAVCRALDLSPGVEWIVTGERGFAARMVTVLRRRRPLVVYLDGNQGEGGLDRTRERGVAYHLPGRTIHVRDGLGRLAARLGCPVHGVAVSWREDGALAWWAERLPVVRGEDPAPVTRRLWDWLFTAVQRDPAQWTHLGMLGAAAACFAGSRLAGPGSGEARSRRRWFRRVLARHPEGWQVCLRRPLEVWEDRLLFDPTTDAFYAAGGLREPDLDLLRREPGLSLAALEARRGSAWVTGPLCRLYQLGLVELRVRP